MWWTDLRIYFFPALCLVCGKRLSGPGALLCLDCEYNLPKTGYRDMTNNPVNQAFWGRVPVEMGTSLFRFEKGSSYQSLLHELKYKGNPSAGLYLGRMLGQELLHSSFSACDILVPVPLHRKRQKKRGYNQSEVIASGSSEITGIPVVNSLLTRSIHHPSQTSKGRYDRYLNVKGNFRISPRAPDVNGMKILLIDDVMTTGSTLEACCLELLRNFNCLLYIATVAIA
ncbi:MAG: ComF family protein [Bacteroidetes bacterium]|nr:ComF family protein [Bacteroidota bacterium]